MKFLFRDWRIKETSSLFGSHRPRPMVQSAAWCVLTNGSSAGWNIVGAAILARLLAPEDFGTVALVTVFYGVLGQFMDFALGPAMVQKADLTEQQSSNLFWICLAYSVVTGVLLACSGPVLVRFFASPQLSGLALAYGGIIIVNALASQHKALLSRAMRYDIEARITLVLGPVVLALAVGLALAGWGLWALVAQAALGGGLRAGLLWWLVPWRPALYRRGAGVRDMVGFGLRSAGALLVNFCYEKGQSLVLGKMGSAAQVGFYTRGEALFQKPTAQIMGPLSVILLPRLSSLQDQPREIEKFVIQTSWFVTLAVTPLMIWMLHGGEQVALLLLGEGWDTAGRVMQWFALVALVGNLVVPLSKACAALGSPAKGLTVRIVLLPLYIFGIVKAVKFGAEAVVAVTHLTNLIGLPFVLYLLFHKSPLRPRPILLEMLKSTACALILSMILIITNVWMSGWMFSLSYDVMGLLRLGLMLGVCYIGGLGTMLCFKEGRNLANYLLSKFKRPTQSIPSPS